MSRSWLAVITLIAATPLWGGCDDGGEGDQCSTLEGRCPVVGALRCSDGNVQRCDAGAQGCLTWADHLSCGDRQVCRPNGEATRCECQDECEDLGLRTCDGDVINECLRDAQGCLYIEGQHNCEISNQSCGTVDGEVACVGCPGDRCEAVGAERCLRQMIERCEEQDDGCLDWAPVEDCADRSPPHYCSEEASSVECVEECADNCEAAGLSRCSGEVIEICVAQDYGCLAWEEGDDCAELADYCDDQGAGAECVSCDDRCAAPGETRCVGSVISGCVADDEGCLDWEAGADCSTLDPVRLCEVEGGEARCVALEGTGSCDSPIYVTEAHYRLAGTSFVADFTNDHQLTGPGCLSAGATVDAVFVVDLAAGETLSVREPGDLDAVLSLQVGACGDAVACEFSEDVDEVVGQQYTASGAERVYVIVETFEPAPRTVDYEIRIDIVEAELCSGAVDEDGDGAVDCDDSDCFGEAPCDAAELNCVDGGDNDGDGAVDCDDLEDCSGLPVCASYQGVYEVIAGADPMDLEGSLVTFTRDVSQPDGYRWTAEAHAAFPVEPTSGVTSRSLSLDDDDIENYFFVTMPDFPFYGTTYSSMFVNSNGFLSFGGWGVSYFLGVDDLFEYPTIAGLMTDLAPNLPSTAGDSLVTVDERVDRVAVTFEHVPYYYDDFAGFIEGPNDFQIVLHRDGTIQIYWDTLSVWEAIVGVASGVGLGDYPDEVDLIP